MQVMLALTKLYLFSKNSGNRSRDFFIFQSFQISRSLRFHMPGAQRSWAGMRNRSFSNVRL